MMENMLWYQALNKPILTPPSWVFGPVWTILYILMGIALYLFIKAKSPYSKKSGLLIFFTQLALNLSWTTIFFIYQEIQAAMIICIILLILVIINIQQFFKISKTAAYLLIPYFLWLCLATYLSVEIVRLNP